MSAGRWNQSALKPHLVSNGKNIKDYYPRRQKGHQHLPHRAIFRRTISQGREKKKPRSQLNTSVGAQTSVSGYFHFRARLKMYTRTGDLTRRHLTRGWPVNIQLPEKWMFPTRSNLTFDPPLGEVRGGHTFFFRRHRPPKNRSKYMQKFTLSNEIHVQ